MMTVQEIYTIFGRREKCFVHVKGHNTDAKYVISRNGNYVTTCGDHLTRGINQLIAQTTATDGKLNVTVWVRP